MELFEWLNVTTNIWSFFLPGAEDKRSLLTILFICMGVAVAIYAVSLVFGGIGMRKMAKSQGIKPSALAFVPFANTYYMGKIAGKTSTFGLRLKNCGLLAMISEIFYAITFVFFQVATIMLLEYEVDGQYLGVPSSMQWMVVCITVCTVLSAILFFVQLFLFASLYTAVYRKYITRHAGIMTILCLFFPVRGFILYAVRNNSPVDYEAYVRQRMERYRQQMGGQGGYGGQNFGGTYSNQGGYGGSYGGQSGQGYGASAPQEDPYGGEFGSSKPQGESQDDPFEEFSSGSDKQE